MANKYTFEFDFKGKTEELERSLSKLQTDFKNLQLPNNIGDSLKKKIEQASDALDNFKNISGKNTFNEADVRKVNQSYEKLVELLEDIGFNYQKLNRISDTKLLSQTDLNNFKKLKDLWDNVTEAQKASKKALIDYNKEFKKYQTEIDAQEAKLKKQKSNLSEVPYDRALKETRKALNRPRISEDKLLEEAQYEYSKLKGKKLQPDQQELRETLKLLLDSSKQQKEYNEAIEETTKKLNDLKEKQAALQAPPAFENNEAVIKFREELERITELDLKNASLDDLKKQLDNLPKEKAEEVKEKISGLKDSFEDIGPAARTAEEGIRGFNDEGERTKEVASEVENLSNRFKQFFSITSGFYLLRRAVRSAYTAVQELDAVMTETAVVTDFTVGDMWKQLPQYTKVANELGVATKDVYEAATLYYQQGLDQQQVEQLNIATLKLARIASLDAAEATDRMTNALRGFNMELNETNANRIADVYSKLAAITAADVDEISTAMTKTASIASSAGMQFETTAAFLSQIIETTRESAETAGTAMKTVIARFQELKKAPDEIGEVDGEIVDANKVEGALRTVGISLRDASGQFRELDEVFLELSSKWNSLDKNTQRYIATIAAGSRQQSRFIAMMQNYSHTMELVDAANNAAGASQQQYEKTLESLESKLARLRNAWNEFALTLANSDLIKGTVDALNWLLTTVNKLTGDSGLAKLGVLVGTFGGGKALASKLFGNEGKLLKAGNIAGEKIKAGIVSGLGKSVGVLGEKTIFKVLLGDSDFNKNLGTIFTFSNGSLGGIKESLLAIIGYRKIDLDLIQKEGDAQKAFEVAVKAGKAALSGYIGIAAAVAAAIFIIYKTWKDNTPEEKLKKQTELVKSLDEQVNVAKQNVDDLKASQESLGEKYKDFELLAEGTQAWKDKLVEVNNEVLDLLDKFPELAGAISRGDNGLLTIDFDSEAYKQFQSQQEQNLRASEINASFGKIDQVNLGSEIDRKSALTATGLDRSVIDAVAKAVANGTIRANGYGGLTGGSELADIFGRASSWGQYQQTILNNIETLRKFGQALLADELQVKTHEEAIRDSLIGGFEEANQAILDAATDFTAIPDKVDESIRQKYTDVFSGEFFTGQLERDFLNTVYSGRDAQIKGTRIVDSNGQQIGVVPDAETMLRALSRNANIEKYSSDLAKFNDFIKDGGQKLGDFGKIITGETLTLDEFGKISARTSDDLKDSAQVIYNYLNHYFPEVFNDFGAFLDNFISKYREQEATYDYINRARDRYDNRLEGNFDIKILEGIYKNLDEVSIKYGKGAAESILSGINDNLNNLSLQDQALALSELNKVDWSDKAQLRGLVETLKDLGITSEYTINTIVSQIIELNHATTKLTFEQLTEKITEFASSIENVKGKVEDGVKTFSKAEYESLISAGANASDFVRTGADQYTYGGKTVDLLSTINGNLVTLVNDYNKNLQERINQGERIDNLSASYKKQLETISTGGLSELGWDDNQVESNLEVLGRAIGLNLEGLDPDRMVEAITKVWNDTYGLNGITYRQNQSSYEGQLRNSRELLYSEQNGQGMLNLYNQIGDEETLKAVQNIRIEENQLQAQLNKTTKAFRDNNIAAEASDEILASLVIDTDKANKKLKVYAEQYSKVRDTLKETNKESAEYQEAVSSLMSSVGNIFDFSFTQDFIDNYKGGIEGLIEDLIAFGEGGEKGEQAYLRMGRAIAEAKIESQGLQTWILETDEYLTALTNADYQIKMTGAADLTPIFVALQKAGWSAEQIAQYLNDIKGWHVEFEVDYDKTQWPIFDEFGSEIDYGFIEVPKAIHAVGENLNTGLDFPDITSSGSGSGSSKKENDNKWENPYNILYNHIEHVNELLRERNKIEFEYNKLIRDNSDAVKVEASLYKEVLANLEEQRKEQQYIYNQAKEGYREQLKDIPYDKYLEEIEDTALKAAGKTRIQQLAGYDFEKNQVYIDWSGIADYEQELKAGGLSDDESKILNALISVTDYLKDTESNMDAAEDALMEIENTIYDIQQNLRETYIQFEDRVIAAIENIRQQEIDNQKQTNEALDSAASDLLNSIRSNIDKMRQDRANENTEEELARKERRLAYLRMDTSGSHNTEIAKLEKELRESQLDYADTLVDQSLQEMQDQNDAAAEQRERQITLMEDQLEWDKENGIIARQASQLIEDSKNLGYVTEDSALYKILYDGEGWASKSKAALDQILQDTNKQFAKAIAALNELLVPANYGDYSAEIDRQIAKYNQATTEEEKAALLATIERLNILRNKKIDDTESEYAKQNSRELIDSILNNTYDPNQWDIKSTTASSIPTKTTETRSSKDNIDYSSEILDLVEEYNNSSDMGQKKSYANQIRSLENARDNKITNNNLNYPKTNGAIANILLNALNKYGVNSKLDIPWIKNTYKFASGGLADFTGPAWLDGTPSKPEIVLNARDSENLIQLRDILRNNQNSGTNIGDSYFDIDINVDEIAGDYDVDRMVDRIKQIIYNDSTRNQVYIPR